MKKILVGLGERQYPILIGSDCLAELAPRICEALPKSDRLMVITNPEIGRLHGKSLAAALEPARRPVEILEIPEGESRKSVATVEKIWDRLITQGYTRQSALIAFGGGVVGDVAGFAAAAYMRGVDFIQIPTTLLAMVDSSVGGKTGVNHPRAKNIIGAFWQPKLVFMDTAFLRTLPMEEFRSGFAEVIKHGVIRDAAYFEYLEKNLEPIFKLEPEATARVVLGSCEIKAQVVARDERESDLRAILNFGHTLGHAIEALAEYGTLRHGEAVSIGMIGATGIAARMGIAPAELGERLRALIEQSGLPTRFPPLETNAVIARLRSDKKVRDGRVRFVLPVRLGEVLIRDDVAPEIIAETIREMMH